VELSIFFIAQVNLVKSNYFFYCLCVMEQLEQIENAKEEITGSSSESDQEIVEVVKKNKNSKKVAPVAKVTGTKHQKNAFEKCRITRENNAKELKLEEREILKLERKAKKLKSVFRCVLIATG